MENYETDLGSGYSMRYFSWAPDRSIEANRINYENAPDIKKAGIIITCPHGDGHIEFMKPGHPVFGEHSARPRWTVESWKPLTLSPSILRRECGCHGFIREGRWVNA